MITENNSQGIILIMIAMSLFAMQDSLIKFIFEQSTLFEIFFGRYLIAALLLFAYIKFTKQVVSLKTYYPYLTFIRVLFHFTAFSTFFVSITYMPLATANALFFSCPFFVSIFAKFFLKEFIGIRRWSAIAFGFTGVLIVLNPNFSNFEYKNLLPVFSAFFYAASMTITKYTSDKDDVNTQLFYFYVIALILCIIIYFFMGEGQFNNKDFDSSTQFIFREWFSNFDYTWQYIVLMGILASIAFTCVFRAYSNYSTSITSIFEYSLIIWSIIIGYFLFDDIPTIRTIAGVIIVMSAGVYIFLREQKRDQEVNLDTPLRR